jgi:hypothetical protein
MLARSRRPSTSPSTSRAPRWVRWSVPWIGLLAVACGSSDRAASPPAPLPAALVAAARPIGRGAAFQPPVRGPVLGPCTSRLGPRVGVHVEVFAANRVVLIPAGIGTRPPRNLLSGRIARAGCYGELVTLDPTGLVLIRPGARRDMADLFRSWGQPLSADRLLSFRASAGRRVEVFVDGHRRAGAPGRVPLRPHAEIVLEVGPHVPPHAAYTFPPGS